MNRYGWNTINSIPSIRAYINTSIIPLPTILLSLRSSTLFETFQSQCTMISHCANLALTWLAVITTTHPIGYSAISFAVALFVSTENVIGLCRSFNLKACGRQELYEIWLYSGSFIICWSVYTAIYSMSNLFCSKVHLIIDAGMNGSFVPLLLSMESISSSHCLMPVYTTCSWWGDKFLCGHLIPGE